MSSERQQSQAARRARALPGLVDPSDGDDDLADLVDILAWASDLSVGDEVAVDTPAGTQEVRIEGFSVRQRTQGQPVVLMPPALQPHFPGDVDVLALREEDLAEEV